MDLTERHHRRHQVRPRRRAVGVRGRRQGLRRADRRAALRHLLLQATCSTQAGITAPPATIDELEAVDEAIKATGIAPIAVGAKDAWPAAHWYYNFALRACSQGDDGRGCRRAASSTTRAGSKAGEDLQAFLETEPFNDGFLTTAAQQGAGSSAGLVANRQAAMELMGAWDPGVIASLTPDEKPLADLLWFPFPAVDGGDGDAGRDDGRRRRVLLLGQRARRSASDFLNFTVEKENQEAYAEAFVTLPASQEAQGVVTDPALQEVLDGVQRGAVRLGVARHALRPEHRQRAERRRGRHVRRSG